MTLLKTLVRSLEAPAARRMRLAAEHKARAQQRYAREALAPTGGQETRRDGRHPYPFHVYGQHTIGR